MNSCRGLGGRTGLRAASRPGIAEGAEFFLIELAGGAEATAGYVEEVE